MALMIGYRIVTKTNIFLVGIVPILEKTEKTRRMGIDQDRHHEHDQDTMIQTATNQIPVTLVDVKYYWVEIEEREIIAAIAILTIEIRVLNRVIPIATVTMIVETCHQDPKLLENETIAANPMNRIATDTPMIVAIFRRDPIHREERSAKNLSTQMRILNVISPI